MVRRPPRPSRIAPLLFAQAWPYWTAVPLAAGAIFFVVATIFGYLTKVTKPKYPPRNEV